MTTAELARPDALTADPNSVHAFLSVLRRDLVVTGRELPIFLAQVILQPLFLLFIFGKVLGSLGYTTPQYAHLLFPGIVALTVTLTGIQSTALPLVLEFSFSREIEDRLLAPLPTWSVAIEKMLFASMRALLAAVVMFPVGIWVLGSIPWRANALGFFVLVMILGALAGSAIGLTLGTLVPPNRIQVMFALILTPMLFTGCSQYPWPSLAHLRWFQVVTAFNPMTYVSEGMRAALTPSVPHMRPWLCLLGLVVSVLLFTIIGVRGFLKRAID
ncbi:MAG: type transport system permease protein [Actinomycetota bacterium]|jgi:ABC-2 type transport system permease protein|nr:type transport system permease protein [Actinomycetota bacterium]